MSNAKLVLLGDNYSDDQKGYIQANIDGAVHIVEIDEQSYSSMYNVQKSIEATCKCTGTDVILGIGKGLGVDDNTRFLTISKNKVNGWHGTAHAFLNIATGKYYV